MQSVYASQCHENSPPRWARSVVASPAAMSTPAQQHRKPKDDAPEYDPLLWSNTDTSYIATLATHAMTYQPASTPQQGGPLHRGSAALRPPSEAFLSSSWNATPQEGTVTRHPKFHSVYHGGPTTWLGRLLQFAAPRLYARWQGNVSSADVRQLSTKELISLMQLALSAGEVDQSAMLARELSRRKLALQLEVFPQQPSAAAAEGAMHSIPSPPDLRSSLTCSAPHPLASARGGFNGGGGGLPTMHPSGGRGSAPGGASLQHGQSTAALNSNRFSDQGAYGNLNASSIWASDLHPHRFERASPETLANGVGTPRMSLYEPGNSDSWTQSALWR
ncbi:hypothetical protein LSCM1_03187 [Leishmania martiniquensis]|uniref:Uncharacterized protein n=1 Tax=Leishmania martiniquensis TaxID=1580590 RepID=A0A836GYR6_9TRYP|nr:hypothetical protein LSCM1_03187 [Leishmania martiniquensis]